MADRREFLAERFGGNSGLQNHHCANPGRVRVSDMTVHHRRHEDVDEGPRLGSGELPLTHSDDFVGIVANVDSASGNMRIAAESPRPVVVRDHGIRFRSRYPVVVLRKQSSQCRLQPKDAEHRPGDILQIGLLHLLIGLVRHIRAQGIRNRDHRRLVFCRRSHLHKCRIGP